MKVKEAPTNLEVKFPHNTIQLVCSNHLIGNSDYLRYMIQSFQQRAFKIIRIFIMCKYLFPESTRPSHEESLHTADRTEHSAKCD